MKRFTGWLRRLSPAWRARARIAAQLRAEAAAANEDDCVDACRALAAMADALERRS